MADDIKDPNSPPPAGKTLEEQIAELTTERDKWKNLSRSNEDKFKAASQERDQLRDSGKSDLEKAIEAARDEAKKAVRAELTPDLVKAEIQTQAAKAGVNVPLEYLDVSRFISDEGKPDAEKVKSLIESMPKPAEKQAVTEFPNIQGAGHQSPAGGNEITSMDPNELADLIAGGRFL
ncbi:hypothetical protein [Streptomyces sp. Tu6071]|uniref:hypothetical protein n=1 Tax=Streptomyces sp. Tu6071 TaxID=355249 RepID=UPI0005B8F135|nr:hypothetical protein [Streptomyces sp. Tu6071]